MNILMILENKFPPDVRVENEASYLASKGYSVSIICISRNKNFVPFEVINKINVYRIYQSKLIYKLGALSLLLPFYFRFWKRSIEHFIQNHKVDIIHLHDLPLSKVINKISKKFNIPYISDFHENRPEIMKYYHHTQSIAGKLLISNRSWQNYQRKYAKLADKLILVTPEAKEYYVNKLGVNKNNISVVPNYADIDSLSKIKIDKQIADKYSSKFTLVYFGDTGLRRGTLTIIEAAELLVDDTDIHFIIIGDSAEQSVLENEISKRKLNNVELTGYLLFEKIISYLYASKVGLCPFIRNIHHDTTYANKMFQTMYFGKPIIASNCTAQQNLLTKEKAGLIFTSGNATELSQKILQLKNNESLYNEASRNAKNIVKNKFNTKVGNIDLLNLYSTFNSKVIG
ncbi:MAG: glycosyltransferase family 4 protein [Bacteroidota bacterium]